MYRQLTEQERERIAIWKGSGVSNKRIARMLRRSTSTIGREIRRNQRPDGWYSATRAQSLTRRRQILAKRRHPLKNPTVYAVTREKLGSYQCVCPSAGGSGCRYPPQTITAATQSGWNFFVSQLRPMWFKGRCRGHVHARAGLTSTVPSGQRLIDNAAGNGPGVLTHNQGAGITLGSGTLSSQSGWNFNEAFTRVVDRRVPRGRELPRRDERDWRDDTGSSTVAPVIAYVWNPNLLINAPPGLSEPPTDWREVAP